MLARKRHGRKIRLEPLAYHVLHDGRRMGPYDRRTIVGLRIKKTLTSEHLLEASDGTRLTVADLIGGQPAPEFNALRSGSYTSARFTCSASLAECEPGAVEIPAFQGEVQVRAHPDMLRIAGMCRTGPALKEARVKLPVKDIVHVRADGSQLALWLRAGEQQDATGPGQRLVLDLFSDESVQELLQWLPDATPPPPEAPLATATSNGPNASLSPMLWAAVLGIVLVAGLLLLVALRRRY
jgi:hypothetical protein